MDEQLKELADAVKAHMELRTAFRARLAVDPEAAALFNMIYAGLMSASAGPAEAALGAAAEIERALLQPKVAEATKWRDRAAYWEGRANAEWLAFDRRQHAAMVDLGEWARLRILLEEVDTGNEAELRAVVAQAYGIVRAHQHMVMGVLRTAPGEEVEGSTAVQPEGALGADAVS